MWTYLDIFGRSLRCFASHVGRSHSICAAEVMCGISALALKTNAPTILREEALTYADAKGATVFGSSVPWAKSVWVWTVTCKWWTVWICMNGYEWIYDWFINMIWPHYNMVRSLTGLINLRLDVSNPSHFCVPTMIIPGTMFQNGPKWLICSVMSRRSAPQRRSLQRSERLRSTLAESAREAGWKSTRSYWPRAEVTKP